MFSLSIVQSELGNILQLPSEARSLEYDASTGDMTPLRVIIANLKNCAQSMTTERNSLRSSHEELELHSETVMKELANCKLQVTHVRV